MIRAIRVTAFVTFLVLYFAVLTRHTVAQTVSPITQEFSKKANGTFTVANTSLAPLAVTIEAKSFTIENGHQILQPLDPTTMVTIKQTSFVLGPKAQHVVGFKIRCGDQPDCHVLLYSNFSPVKHAESGFDVAFHVPSVVYSCSAGQKHCRKNQLAAMNYTP